MASLLTTYFTNKRGSQTQHPPNSVNVALESGHDVAPDWTATFTHWEPPALPTRTLPSDLVDLTGQVEKEQRCVSGFGGFADVWKGKWTHDAKTTYRMQTSAVAIKELRVYADDSDYKKKAKRLRRELKVWKQLDHPNIVPLYGISYSFGPLPAMICPWMSAGTLNEHLKRHPVKSEDDRWYMMFEILRGLTYLHDLDIVHGDLSGANVLVDHQGRCYLTDFGLSTVVSDLEQSCFVTSSNHGAVRWAAPETYSIEPETPGNASRKSKAGDIYSFGSLILQVFTGRLPWAHIDNVNLIIVALINAESPPRPDGRIISDGLWSVIQFCWTWRPQERPTARQLHPLLVSQRFSSAEPPLGYNTPSFESQGARVSIEETKVAQTSIQGAVAALRDEREDGESTLRGQNIVEDFPLFDGISANGSPFSQLLPGSASGSPFVHVSPFGSPFTRISPTGSPFANVSPAGSPLVRVSPGGSGTGSPEYVMVGTPPAMGSMAPAGPLSTWPAGRWYPSSLPSHPPGPTLESVPLPTFTSSPEGGFPTARRRKQSWHSRLNSIETSKIG